jgi:hypothetical protein
LEVFEKQLGVFLLVVRGFLKDGGYLLIALFFGYAGEESVSGSSLRFACKRG